MLGARGGGRYCPARSPKGAAARVEDAVLKALWNRFSGPEAEVRRLSRDAEFILHSLLQEHYGPIRTEVAEDLRKDIDYVFETFLRKDDVYGLRRAEDHLKRLHSEARRRRDQRALTSLTLTIIYVRADKLGDLGRPVAAAIDGFLAEWCGSAAGSGVLPPTGN